MITRTALKTILVSNREHIESKVGKVLKRAWHRPPPGLAKTVVLYGVRRSGKTWILYDMFLENRERAAYLDFEDDRLAGFEESDFQVVLDVLKENPAAGSQGFQPVLLLDEVQQVNGWEKFCRRAVEREGALVFVSGSSSRMMPLEMKTELRGRSWSVEVLPYSFAELCASRGLDVNDQKNLYGSGQSAALVLSDEFIRWGGFPEVVSVGDEYDKAALLREYMSAMYFRDLVEKYRIANIPLFDALSEKVFTSFGLEMSISSFCKSQRERLPFSKDLAYSYYKHMLESMLIFETRVYAESQKKRLRNPSKLFLVDNGLARRVTSEDSGRLLENAVFMELHRRGIAVSHYSGQNGCDFICRTPEGGLSAVQVTWELSDGNMKREFDGLAEACRHIGAKSGVIVTRADSRTATVDGVSLSVVPAWRWWLGAE
jgi:predicted AAA+ superfamily ATPase